MSKEQIEKKLAELVGLHCTVARNFEFDGDDNVSFSVGGVLEAKSCFYRLNVTTVSFVSFTLDDVTHIFESRIELR